MKNGRFKHISNPMRDVSQKVSYLQIFGNIVAPVLGDLAIEEIAAGITAAAGIVDVGGRLIEKDYRGALQEAFEAACETAVVAAPLVTYGKLGTLLNSKLGQALKLPGFDVREKARSFAANIASTTFNKASNDNPPPPSAGPPPGPDGTGPKGPKLLS